MGYLKKKVKDERGVWVPVYANTPEELEAKVAARLVQIEEAKALGIETDTPEQLARYKEEWSR